MRNPKSRILVIVAGLILVAAVVSTIIGVNSGSRLGIYTGHQEVQKYIEPETEPETKQTFDYELVQPFALDLSYYVPVGWIKTMEDDTCTFVHRESGTAIKVQVLPYDPEINNVTEQSAANSVVSNSMTYMGYQRLSNAAYELYYSDVGVTTYDYIEEVMWDLEHIVKFICICKDSYYEELKDVFATSFNSFTWNQTNPIPQAFVMSYAPAFEYEFAFPYDWYIYSTGGISYAQNAEGSAKITVTPYEFDGGMKDVTVELINQILNAENEKNNFLLRQYDASEEKGYVQSSYTEADAMVQERTLLYPKSGVLYVETISYYPGQVDESSLDLCLSLFRSFREETVQEETSLNQDELYQSDIQNAEQAINDFLNTSDPETEEPETEMESSETENELETEIIE